MENIKDSSEENKDIVFRKCNAIFIFWGILFGIILIILITCFLNSSMNPSTKSSVLEFLVLSELIIIICFLETYMDILIVGKNGVRFESGIILTHKDEIPYNKINNVKIDSIFGFATLEIYTGNDKVNRYKFLHKYEEVGKIIKERIDNNKK